MDEKIKNWTLRFPSLRGRRKMGIEKNKVARATSLLKSVFRSGELISKIIVNTFFDRVDRTNSLFHIVPDCTEEACDTEQLDMDRCQCQWKPTGQLSIKCNLPLMQFNSVGEKGDDITGVVEKIRRKKRDLVYSDDIIYLYDDEEPKRNIHNERSRRAVNTKMSLENATEYCRNAIMNSAAAKVCLEISGVNSSNAIEACAADLQVIYRFSLV